MWGSSGTFCRANPAAYPPDPTALDPRAPTVNVPGPEGRVCAGSAAFLAEASQAASRSEFEPQLADNSPRRSSFSFCMVSCASAGDVDGGIQVGVPKYATGPAHKICRGGAGSMWTPANMLSTLGR